jgi:predicted ATPase/DNA-binding SARP family transcriptional activator
MTPTAAEQVEFGILGPLEVRVGGAPLPMRQGLTRAVLLALLLRPNATVSTDVLIDELYGDELPVNPLNALQVQVSHLRRALSTVGAAEVLVTEATGYRLAVSASAIDAARFAAFISDARRLCDDGRAEALESAIEHLDGALALWRGEPLSDVAYRDFAASEIARLAELRLAARELRAEIHLRLGHHRDIAADLQALVEEHPLRERPRELLILALYRAGRQSEALREYEAVRRLLADDLGLEPGPELRRLERAVLAHDPALDWSPSPNREPVPARAADRPREVASAAPLPAPPTAIVAREAELAELDDLFERSRAVTLTGTGGAGKTRLAVEYAATTDATTWFVDLGPLSDHDAVANDVAAAFGLTIRSGEDPLAGVAALGPAGLLVLDTCEHVVEAAANAVSHLLRHCPRLRVLATSRRPLDVAGELLCVVAPLGLPEMDATLDPVRVKDSPAVRLLLERARGVRPDLALDEDNAADIAAICVAVDGLPLAVELAAARLDVLSPSQLRRRLRDRFTLLNAGSRDATERQRTLRAAVDWSYELLSSEERRLFQRLAVLPGPFTVDLGCALVDGVVVAEPLELLRSLVRQSVVTRRTAEHFGMLDTLQAYAGERADASETGEALKALTHWAAEVTLARDRALRGPNQLEALSALRHDLPNLRAALEWSLAEGNDPHTGARIAGRLGWFWHLTGMYEEGHRWTARAAAVEDASHPIRVAALRGAGLHASALGQLDRARTYLSEAVEVGARVGTPAEARARAHRGEVYWWSDNHDEADADLTVAAAASAPGTESENLWVHTFALLHLGRVRLRQQRYDDANALFAEAEPHLDDLGDRYLAELALRFRSRGTTLQGDPATAEHLAREALARAEQLGHTEGIAISLVALGEAQRELGHLDDAHAVLRRGVEFSVAADHIGSVCQALSLLIAIDAQRGDTAKATTLLGELLAAQAAAGLPLLTPGGVVQQLVDDLLGGRYPTTPPLRDDRSAARARAQVRAIALAYLG